MLNCNIGRFAPPPTAYLAVTMLATPARLLPSGGDAPTLVPVYDLAGRPLGFYPLAPGVSLPQATAPQPTVALPARSPVPANARQPLPSRPTSSASVPITRRDAPASPAAGVSDATAGAEAAAAAAASAPSAMPPAHLSAQSLRTTAGGGVENAAAGGASVQPRQPRGVNDNAAALPPSRAMPTPAMVLPPGAVAHEAGAPPSGGTPVLVVEKAHLAPVDRSSRSAEQLVSPSINGEPSQVPASFSLNVAEWTSTIAEQVSM